MSSLSRTPLPACLIIMVAACGGGGDGSPNPAPAPPAPPPVTAHPVGGTVTGLVGRGLVLRLNSSSPLEITSDGAFTFPGTLASGTEYTVSVSGHPHTPVQRCSVSNGTGSVSGAVTNVSVSCETRYARFAFAGNADGTVSRLVVDSETGQLHSRGFKFVAAGSISDVVTTSDDAFAYALDRAEERLIPHSIEASGDLRQISSGVSTGGSPADAEMDPGDRYVYVANTLDGTISAFAIDSASGGLAEIAGSPFPTGEGVLKVLIDSVGMRLYALSYLEEAVFTYAIDQSSGALTSLGPPIPAGGQPLDMVISPHGRFAYVSNDNDILSTVSIAASGELEPIDNGLLSAGAGLISLGIDPSGRFLFTANEGGSVSMYELGDGGLPVEVDDSPFSVDGAAMHVSIDGTGQFLYVGTAEPHAMAGFRIDHDGRKILPMQRSARMAARPFQTRLRMTSAAQPTRMGPARLFVLDGNGSISAYRVDGDSGALDLVTTTPVTNTSSGTPAVALATDTFGKRLLATVWNQKVVTSFRVDADGTPTIVGHYPTSHSPYGLKLDQSDRFAYVTFPDASQLAYFEVDANGNIDLRDGRTTTGSPWDVAATPVGDRVYATTSLGSIIQYGADPVTGNIEQQASAGFPNPSYAIVSHPNSRFAFVAMSDGNQILVYTPTSEVTLAQVDSASTCATPLWLAVHPDGSSLYVTCRDAPGIHSYRINETTGGLTHSVGSPYVSLDSFGAMAVDAGGRHLFAIDRQASAVVRFDIDQDTGALVKREATPVPPSPVALVVTSDVR